MSSPITCEKGPTDYAAVEAYIGTPFFSDIGRTAIAQDIIGEEALVLADRNPVRNWIFKAATRELALGTPENDMLINKLGQRLKLINNLEQYIANYESGLSGSKLDDHQGDVFHNLAKFMRGDPTRKTEDPLSKAGYIEMPMGSGKTVIIAELLRAFHGDNTIPIKSLVLVPKKEILKQTVGKNGKRGFAEFAPDLDVTTYFGDNKDFSGEVVVMTYQSFNNALAKGIIDQDFCDVLICDEAHRALGPVTKKNIEEFRKDKVAVATTATSEFSENKKVEHLFPEKIHNLPLREAINRGILAPVQCWVYKTDVKVDQNLSHPDYTPGELKFLAQIEGRNQKAVEFAKAFIEQGLQGVISCLPGEEVLHPKIVAEMLRDTFVTDPHTGEQRLIRAQALSGKMPLLEREKYYEAYEAGKIDVLTFVDTIGEGWDSKVAKFLINLRPTCSPVLGIQRVGRILRHGAVAHVVDFIDRSQKAQFVALHALGEYRYVLGKVYGGKPGGGGLDVRNVNLPEELKDSIQRVNMVRVKKLVIGREHIAEYSDYVDMQTVGERMGLHPLSLVYIARDQDIPLRVEGTDALDVVNVNMLDMTEEKLYKIARSKKYAFLHKAEDAILRAFVIRQSEILAEKARNNPLYRRQRYVRPEVLEKASPEKLIQLLHEGLVTYEDLPINARRVLEETDLPTSQITRILFDISGEENEKLRRSVYARMVGEAHNPMYILNYAQQIGGISLSAKLKPPKQEQKVCEVSLRRQNGRQITVEALGPTYKIAKFKAHFMALGETIGLAEITDDLEITPPQEELEGPNARFILHQFVQSNKLSQPLFAISHVLGSGKHQVFTAKIVLKLSNGKILRTEGSGNSKKEAEEAAALEMIGMGQILKWRTEQAPTSKAPGETLTMQHEQPRSQGDKKLESYIMGVGTSTNMLIRQSQKNIIADLAFNFEDLLNHGRYKCTVTFVDETGEEYSFIGRGYGKKKAKSMASKAALMSDVLKHHIKRQANIDD
jgi:superfamily II DNA or RNA helicase